MEHKYSIVEHYKKGKIGKSKKKLIVFAIFLVLAFFLIFFAFFESGNLTGNVVNIGGKESNTANLVKITADLTLPFDDLNIKGDIDQIELKADRIDNFFYAGGEKFDLTNSEKMNLIITNYDGKISFDANNILKLKGKATEVLINGVLMRPESGINMKVKFKKDIQYNSLKLNGVFIDLLYYTTTSGTIKLNEEKMVFNIDNEEVKIEKFQGDLEIRGNQFKLNGHVKKINVIGEPDISIT